MADVTFNERLMLAFLLFVMCGWIVIDVGRMVWWLAKELTGWARKERDRG